VRDVKSNVRGVNSRVRDFNQQLRQVHSQVRVFCPKMWDVNSVSDMESKMRSVNSHLSIRV
jgi:hypothetical protein